MSFVHHRALSLCLYLWFWIDGLCKSSAFGCFVLADCISYFDIKLAIESYREHEVFGVQLSLSFLYFFFFFFSFILMTFGEC